MCECCESPNVAVSFCLSTGAEVALCIFCYWAWGYTKTHPVADSEPVAG